MVRSTDAAVVGVYGLLRGILGVLLGLVLAAEVGAFEPVVDATGFAVGGSIADVVTVVGAVVLLAGIVLAVGGIGLLVEKEWGPILSVLGFAVLAVVGILALATAGIEIVTVVILLLDLVAVVWSAMQAPRIPIGGDRQQAQAV